MKKTLEITIEGTSDKAAFMKAASDAFDTYVASISTDYEKIGLAVNAVFDRYKGVKLNVPALETFVLAELGVEPSTFGLMTERLKGYLADNKSEKREDGKLYGTAKGKNGGIWRWKDQPVKA